MLKKRAFRIFIYFAAVLLVIWSLAPIAWMVISSITPSNQMVQSERILPDSFTVDRYKKWCCSVNKLKALTATLQPSPLYFAALW